LAKAFSFFTIHCRKLQDFSTKNESMA
jgi:hypothetical protein